MKVLIVGAGPTGLFLACKLIQFGIQPTLIDKSPNPSTLPKAVGVSNASLALLSTLGLQPTILKQANLIDHINIHWLNRIKNRISMKYLPLPNTRKFVFLNQISTEKILTDCLMAMHGEVLRNIECTALTSADNQMVASLKNNDSITKTPFDWIVACDGASSSIRTLLKMEVECDNHAAYFVLLDAHCTFPNRGEVGYYLSTQGYLMLVPLGEDRYRIIASFKGPMPDKTIPEDNKDYFSKIVKDRAGIDINIMKVIWSTSSPLRYQYAKDPIKERCVLAGDAFHTFSPVGGTTMNMAFQDIHNLAWKLAYAARNWADTKLIDSYRPERLNATKQLVALSTKVTRSITQVEEQDPFTKEKFQPIMANKTWLHRTLPEIFSGFNQHYNPDSSQYFSQEKDTLAGKFIGDIADWIQSTEVNHLQHHLICFLHKRDQDTSFCKDLQMPEWVHTSAYQMEHLTASLVKLLKLIKANTYESFYLLVRPDGYIALSGIPNNTSPLQKYFRNMNE